MIYRQKKAGRGPGLEETILISSRSETGGVDERRLGTLYIAQCFPNNLLSYTCAFAALGGDTRGFAYLTITAAAFVNGFTDLTVGNTLAKTHVHKNYPLGL